MRERTDWKVGLFVLIGLMLLGALILSFGKGPSWFQPTYALHLRTDNVSGIKSRAGVLMAGVTVGTVGEISLASDGKSALIELRLRERFRIRTNALFTIEQAGLLGDQYVSVRPGTAEAPYLQPGAEVHAEAPFELQQVARSASGLVERFDETAKKLSDAVGRIDRILLTEENLTSAAATITNFQRLSERASSAVEGLDELVSNNAPFIGAVITNLSDFSRELDKLASEMRGIIDTNRTDLSQAVENFEASSAIMKNLLTDVQQGRGVVGGLLQNDEMRLEVEQMIGNLTTLSSNLNRYGLLYRPRQPRSELPTPPLRRGRDPFQ